MKKIVIVGAGPIGLYLACFLRQHDVKDIIVIDPRTGPYDEKLAATKDSEEIKPESSEYVRPGVINESNFIEIAKDLGIDIPYSLARHIKELERGLYKGASEYYEIPILKAKFVSLASGGIKIEYASSGKQEILDCDCVFDASGQNRVVISQVNQESKEPTFKIKQAADNPVKNHFIAYVKLDELEYQFLKNHLEQETKPDKKTHALALANLHNKYGWTYFADPEIKIQLLENNKACFYFETPPNLKKEDQESYLQDLLLLKTGKKIKFETLKKSRKFPKGKPRFTPFTVDPQMVTPGHVSGLKDYPTVIGMGDSVFEPDYRKVTGIKFGIERVKLLVSNSKINKETGEIEIDFDAYEKDLDLLTKKSHIKILSELYSRREHELHLEFADNFKDVLQVLKEPCSADEKAILNAFLQKMKDMKNQVLSILFKKGFDQFHSLFTEEKKSDKKFDLIKERIKISRLEKIENNLIACFKLIDKTTPIPAAKAVKETLHQVAKKFHELGNYYFKLGKFDLSDQCYTQANDIFSEYFLYIKNEDIINLSLDWMVVLHLKKEYNNIISLADMALDVLEYAKMEQDAKLVFAGKLKYKKTLALVSQGLEDLPTDSFSMFAAKKRTDEIQSLIDDLTKNPAVNKDNLVILKGQLEHYKEIISQPVKSIKPFSSL